MQHADSVERKLCKTAKEIGFRKGYTMIRKTNRFAVVTLCGSTRFYDEYMEAIKQLTMEGSIVLYCPFFHNSVDKEQWDAMSEPDREEMETRLTLMHYQRIDMSDAIMVISVDGYIGASTKKEIEYARSTGKGVLYFNKN